MPTSKPTSSTQTPSPEQSTPNEFQDKKAKSAQRSRTGKVARLQRDTRDWICRLLRDGFSYAAILKKVGDDAKGITIHNLSQWRQGGYHDWLQEQLWLDEIVSFREDAAELVDEDYTPVKLHQAALQLAVIQIFKALKAEKFNEDPQNHTRMLNALSRLSREALLLTKYRKENPDPDEDDDDDRYYRYDHLKAINNLIRASLPRPAAPPATPAAPALAASAPAPAQD